MENKIIVSLLCISLVFLAGCARSVQDVKQEDNVGEEILVRGEVSNSIKFGELSGYTLTDDTGSIAIASDELPEEGSTKSIRGILRKNMLLGYYIEVE